MKVKLPMTDLTSNRLLIRHAAHLMTGQAGSAMRHDASAGTDIRVQGGLIQAIGRLTPEPGERVIDASGCVVYPGWVNTHHHLFQSLLKGIPAGISVALTPWLAAVPVPYRQFFNTEHAMRIAARIGLVELLLSGCTTVADHQYHYYSNMPFDVSAVVFDEAEKLGLRFVLCRGGQTMARVFDHPAPPESSPETLDAIMSSIERDVRRFHDPSPTAMRRVVTTPNWSCQPDELLALARQARRLGIRLHSHLNETYDYVKYFREVHACSAMQFAEKHEWVGPDVWFAHMVHLSDDDIARCAQTGTGIAHCPQSNARLGSGIARVPDMLKAGAPVSLAVDGAASNEAADMLSEAHACWLLHRAKPLEFGGAFGGDAGAISADQVIQLGTAASARMLGLDGVGTLAVGMAADLAVYDLDQPRHFGLHDAAIAPVVSGGQASLRAVLVGGRVVVENNRIPGLDMAELRMEASWLVKHMVATMTAAS
jgi:8-oxoguanine deaminase